MTCILFILLHDQLMSFQFLFRSSAGVANAAYESIWFDEGTAYKKCLIQIITKSQKFQKITVYKFLPMSFATFATVSQKLNISLNIKAFLFFSDCEFVLLVFHNLANALWLKQSKYKLYQHALIVR